MPSLLPAECEKVPAVAFDPSSRQRVEGADEERVEREPFPAAVQPALDGKALVDEPHVGEPVHRATELLGTVLMEDRRTFVLEIDLHQLRQRVQPGNAVVALEHRFAARLQHPAHFVHEPSAIRGVLHDAVREHVVEMVVGKRQSLTVGDEQGGAAAVDVATFCRASRIADSDRSTPTTRALPRAKRTRSTPVPHPRSSTALPGEPVERDQRQQMMQLVEMIVVEIAKEFGRAGGMRRDRQIVNVLVPVGPHSRGQRTLASNRLR